MACCAAAKTLELRGFDACHASRSPRPSSWRPRRCPATARRTKRFMGGPVTLEDQGSFFVGGVTKVSEYATVPGAPPGQQTPPRTPQQITIGQMYVQFQIPARVSAPGWPVIMVHGSTHTGAALESTPDGREGWYPYFVRKGVATYVVDQSGRGRSGFDQSVLHEAEARLAGRQSRRRGRAAADVPAHHRQRRIPRPGSAICFRPARRSRRAGLSRTARPRIRKAGARPRSRTSRRCSRSRPSTSTTSSSCRTPRPRCRARRARRACRKRFRRPTPGRRRTWRRSSSGWAARSSRRTRSPASWATTWFAS